jgi:cytidylate kinase
MPKPLVIAIDGPSASGKGTIAKKLAKYFNLPYLNTGALYRFFALKLIENSYNINEIENYISPIGEKLDISDLENEKLFSEEVGVVASKIAKNQKLRNYLLDFQKNFTNSTQGAVLDGRDTTSVIAREADFKFYITAKIEIRAKRRYDQLKTSYEEILNNLKVRDENDISRKESPLIIVKDAIIIDNSDLSIHETFEHVLKIIESKSSKVFLKQTL